MVSFGDVDERLSLVWCSSPTGKGESSLGRLSLFPSRCSGEMFSAVFSGTWRVFCFSQCACGPLLFFVGKCLPLFLVLPLSPCRALASCCLAHRRSGCRSPDHFFKTFPRWFSLVGWRCSYRPIRGSRSTQPPRYARSSNEAPFYGGLSLSGRLTGYGCILIVIQTM